MATYMVENLLNKNKFNSISNQPNRKNHSDITDKSVTKSPYFTRVFPLELNKIFLDNIQNTSNVYKLNFINVMWVFMTKIVNVNKFHATLTESNNLRIKDYIFIYI